MTDGPFTRRLHTWHIWQRNTLGKTAAKRRDAASSIQRDRLLSRSTGSRKPTERGMVREQCTTGGQYIRQTGPRQHHCTCTAL